MGVRGHAPQDIFEKRTQMVQSGELLRSICCSSGRSFSTDFGKIPIFFNWEFLLANHLKLWKLFGKELLKESSIKCYLFSSYRCYLSLDHNDFVFRITVKCNTNIIGKKSFELGKNLKCGIGNRALFRPHESPRKRPD